MARIVFMGSSEFACASLRALGNAGHNIVCVYTKEGSTRRMRPTPVAGLASELGYPLRFPASLTGQGEHCILTALTPDIVVVAAYGLILPPSILEIPEYGCLNVHASELPRWRGAAPIARAIMAGDAATGVSIMRMEAGLDTGPVMECVREDIAAVDTRADLEARLAAIGARLIVAAVADVLAGRAQFCVQPQEGVTYADKLDVAGTRIDWNEDAERVRRHIHALSPEPGAWCHLPDGQRLRILSCAVEANRNGDAVAGEFLDRKLLVACDSGAVRLMRVQRAGGKPMDGCAFQNGARLKAGQRLW